MKLGRYSFFFFEYSPRLVHVSLKLFLAHEVGSVEYPDIVDQLGYLIKFQRHINESTGNYTKLAWFQKSEVYRKISVNKETPMNLAKQSNILSPD